MRKSCSAGFDWRYQYEFVKKKKKKGIPRFYPLKESIHNDKQHH